jgi:modification methylase
MKKSLKIKNQNLIINEASNYLRKNKEKYHLIVTSPPYFDIKDYGIEKQIGYGQTYQDFIGDLIYIFNLCSLRLYPGCKMCINVGDQFKRATKTEDFYLISIMSDIIRELSKTMFYQGNIIWRKFTNQRTSGGCKWMGSIYYPRDGVVSSENEYILIFKKAGKSPKVSQEQKENSKLSYEERKLWFRSIWEGIKGVSQKYLASFPVESPERLIKMFSYSGETIFDPFVGSGTTLIAAEKLGRKGVGIDVDSERLLEFKERMAIFNGII